MNAIHVPDAAISQPGIHAGEISFVNYRDKGGPFRNRVIFDRYAFSFVQNGQKQIYRASKNTVLTTGQGMLIPEGHSIIAEHSDTEDPYHSIIVFFPGRIGREFLAGRAAKPGSAITPYIHFNTSAYIHMYVRNIQALIEARTKISYDLAVMKVQELLLAVYEHAPAELISIFQPGEDWSLKQIIEDNLFNNLSLEELAFLTNRSLSSFKRDFEKAYGLSPQKYIRERKLELACAELLSGKLASELYLDYGYENLSNFNTAFKRKYGVTPSAYKQSA